MSVFNLPQTLSTTNSFNADYATLRRASAADSTNPADTATKVHWSSNASTHVMFFAELDSNGNVTIDVNTSPTTSQPSYVSKVSSTERIHGSITVTNGDTIYLQHSSVHLGSFVWNSSYVVAGGPGTLSTADTASFAGTTPQQIQWAITNGSSPVANSNYYLFNETPGGNALDTINLGSNPQVGSTSTESYINPSGADFTGKWYIGYGQNSTRVNLKVYDFSSRKVFCNFW